MSLKTGLVVLLLTGVLSYVTASTNPCEGLKNETIAAISSDCGEFIYCLDEKPFNMKCPDDLVYSPPFHGCTKSEYVEDCGGRYLDCRFTTGFFPSEASCQEFYRCQDGKKYRQICPSDLHFDYPSRTCTDPESAACLKKVITL